MFDEQVDALMSSIYLNATHNIERNGSYIDDEEDSEEMAAFYIADYASVVAESINSVENKEDLLEAIQTDIIENAWVLKVLLHYRSELQRNIELEEESCVQELMHERPNKQEPKPNPIYTLIKENNVKSN